MLLKFTKTSGAGAVGLGSSPSSIQATTTYAVRGGGTGLLFIFSTLLLHVLRFYFAFTFTQLNNYS